MTTPASESETLMASRVTSFKVDDAEYRLLERIAAEDDRSVSAVIRLAIRQYVDSRLGRDGRGELVAG